MTHGRYEFKYSVTAEQRLKVLDAANEFLVADPHGEAATYPVSSLYFDTAAREAYWSKLDGERYRKKFRLRYYEADPVSETVSASLTWANARANRSSNDSSGSAHTMPIAASVYRFAELASRKT